MLFVGRFRASGLVMVGLLGCKAPPATPPSPLAKPVAPVAVPAADLDAGPAPDFLKGQPTARGPFIDRPGSFHASDLAFPAKSKPQMLALCDGALKSVTARVEVARDDVDDDPDGPFTGKSLSVPCDALFVMSHIPGLRPGPVTTATLKGNDLSSPVAIELGEHHGIVSRTNIGETGYRLVFETETERVVLFESNVGFEGSTEVLWAGDLDHDGRIDLILNASEHYNISSIRLFLSSGSRGAPLRQVAVHHTLGC